MLVIRLITYLVLAAIAVSLLLYVFNNDPRWLKFAWQTFKLAVVLFVIFALFFLLERLILIA